MSIELNQRRARARRWGYETRLLLGGLIVAMPALLSLLVVLWVHEPPHAYAWLLSIVITVITVLLALELRRRAIYPLRTLSNLLEALREGDYSLRGSAARRGDAIGEVVIEINTLAQTLREQRLAVEEKSALLTKVIAALDIAVLAFDAESHLKLANPAAERLLGSSFNFLKGRSAAALGLGDCLSLTEPCISERSFAGGNGRWEVRRAVFREDGRPHDLLVITDLSRTLREEERLAWQRLLRVLGHELNNSLAPIRSMAATLAKLLAVEPMAEDWRDDAGSALGVIGDRAEALARFMARYTAFARLPPPKPRRFAFAELVQRVAHLEQRMAVVVEAGAAVDIDADPDQIEQALINLLKNAVDATLPDGGKVRIRWQCNDSELSIEIIDAGSGLPHTENLFVPFFTTKPGGSGIGLVLARQIFEAHGGSLTLENRGDAQGCVARGILPR
ncbi:MAG TPA: ATP-binding protein [Dokdonella sp.]|nr:ATP-binding protein [Dokdonella sp.]